MHLPDLTSFGWMTKYINHSKRMSNLHTPVKTQSKQIKGKHSSK